MLASPKDFGKKKNRKKAWCEDSKVRREGHNSYFSDYAALKKKKEEITSAKKKRNKENSLVGGWDRRKELKGESP